MVLTGLATGPGSGPTLRASLHQTAAAAVEACVLLVRCVPWGVHLQHAFVLLQRG